MCMDMCTDMHTSIPTGHIIWKFYQLRGCGIVIHYDGSLTMLHTVQDARLQRAMLRTALACHAAQYEICSLCRGWPECARSSRRQRVYLTYVYAHLYTHVHAHVYTYRVCMIHIYMSEHMFVHLWIHMSIRKAVHMFAHKSVNLCMHMSVHMSICMPV